MQSTQMEFASMAKMSLKISSLCPAQLEADWDEKRGPEAGLPSIQYAVSRERSRPEQDVGITACLRT